MNKTLQRRVTGWERCRSLVEGEGGREPRRKAAETCWEAEKREWETGEVCTAPQMMDLQKIHNILIFCNRKRATSADRNGAETGIKEYGQREVEPPNPPSPTPQLSRGESPSQSVLGWIRSPILLMSTAYGIPYI